MSRKRPTAATFASKINFAIIIIVIIIIIVVASVSLFGVWIHKKRIIIILDMMIIIIILDMIIIVSRHDARCLGTFAAHGFRSHFSSMLERLWLSS